MLMGCPYYTFMLTCLFTDIQHGQERKKNSIDTTEKRSDIYRIPGFKDCNILKKLFLLHKKCPFG